MHLRAKRTPRRQRHLSVWYVQFKNECSRPYRKHLPASGTLAQDFRARTKVFTVYEPTSPKNYDGLGIRKQQGFHLTVELARWIATSHPSAFSTRMRDQ